MATRIEIAADMRRTFTYNALTKKQVGQYMGMRDRATYDFLMSCKYPPYSKYLG